MNLKAVKAENISEVTKLNNQDLLSMQRVMDELKDEEVQYNKDVGGPLDGGRTPDILKYSSKQYSFDNVDLIHEERNKRVQKGFRNLSHNLQFWTKERRGRPVSPPR